MRKILLNKSRSKLSVNENNTIPIDFNRDVSLFHDEHLIDTVDTMEVYNSEKDNSNKHRIICTIAPICSNVLFNNITEVVVKEGASNCTAITNTNNVTLTGAISKAKVNRIQAVRNTEYSNAKYETTYHCGADIFNNHILRSKGNVLIQKTSTTSKYKEYSGANVESVNSNGTTVGDWDYNTTANLKTNEYDSFNTIGDYVRNYNGNVIKSYYPTTSSGNYQYTYQTKVSGNTPIYGYDTIMNFHDAFKEGIKRHDGWIGFNNRTTLRVPITGTSTDGYFVNKCINSLEACEYVDMCPERDLFSFTPKKNEYRNRLEYNWKYYITYPADSVYNDGKILTGKGDGLPLTTMSILGMNSTSYREYTSSNGLPMIVLCSVVKHNLTAGDTVIVILKNGERFKCGVTRLGDAMGNFSEHYFVIYKSDIDESVLSSSNPPKRFIKLSGGFECEYYFRRFKCIKEGLKSSINRLAFAGTVYGDEVSQIVFTDDINVSGYVNNLGRSLNELYLTIVKNNKGYDKWYYDNKFNDEGIEYSHVFGKVTSGLDLPSYISKQYPVLRYQHNIKIDDVEDKINIPSSSQFLESNIDNGTMSFLGDLVEFNPTTVAETTLEVVKHRFNTAQREVTKNETFKTLYYDEIYSEPTDGENYGKENNIKQSQIIQWKLNEGYANLNPEGYIYTPHHKIKISELSDNIQMSYDTVIKVKSGEFKNNYNLVFTTENSYSLMTGDIIGVLEYSTNELYKYQVESYKLTENGYECTAKPIGTNVTYIGRLGNSYELFRHNLDTPVYSYMLPDGSGRHVWRELIKPSELRFNSELYNTPFTNGAFYHHINVTFPVQRQDPFGEYGMYLKDLNSGVKIENNFEISSNEMDISYDEYIPEKNATCF